MSYTQKGEWTKISVHASETGYVMDQESRIQGTHDGLKKLLPYSTRFPRGMNLEGNWNEHMSNGDMVIAEARAVGRTLKRGNVVQ